MKIGSLVVEIAADSSKFDSAVVGTETRLSTLSKKATAAVGNFAKYSAAAAAAGGAITAALYVKASKAIDAQAKLAQQLNTTSSSMATITRAGELSGIGMEKIASAGRAVTTRLGQASAGMGPAIDGLERLNLSADKLAGLPLDERIATINQRIRETIPASQQAAIAAQFFGEEAGTAILTLSGDTLAQARKETELFGLALSDVDAAKVEQANDAFSTFGMAADGIIQQLTVQLAPIVKAISDEFVNAADEAGGFGNVAIDAFAKVIDATAFVVDAGDGVKRVFQLAADAIVASMSWAAGAILKDVAWVIEQLDKIPGLNYGPWVDSLRQMSETSSSIVGEAMNNIDETLSRPMAGDALRQFVEDARVAGEAAAQAAVAGRSGMEAGDEGGSTVGLSPADQEALNAKIEAIRQANLSEVEALVEKQALEMEAINAHNELKLENEEAWNQLFQNTKARHEDELTSLDKRASEQRKRQAEQEARAKQAIMSQALSGLTSLMNSENKRMFEIGKRAAIANSLVSTYQGMSKALELGFPVGLIAAAAVGVAGFAQVQNIRSQSFQGGGGGAAAMPSTATSQVNAQAETAQGNPGSTQTMMVSGIDEGELFSGGRVRSIVGELLEYQRNGGTVILE